MMNTTRESGNQIRILDKFFLHHVVDIEPSFLRQFDIIESRLTVDLVHDTYSSYKSKITKETPLHSDICGQLKKDAAAVGQELLLQHVSCLVAWWNLIISPVLY